jgi:uncharacterized damage-inducible protein DinB
MRRSKTFTAAILAVFTALTASAAIADEAAPPAGLKADMLVWFKDAESKLIQLAEVTPEAKYSWRPGKDVRSTGEVFMHVSGGNYLIPSFWGVKPPEGFDANTYEKSLTKKADVVKSLKDSFAQMEQDFLATADSDFDKPVDLFGTKTTVRGGYLLLLSHCHEHLGQSIAYARTNGIVPPWTARQQAAAKEKAKAADNK